MTGGDRKRESERERDNVSFLFGRYKKIFFWWEWRKRKQQKDDGKESIRHWSHKTKEKVYLVRGRLAFCHFRFRFEFNSVPRTMFGKFHSVNFCRATVRTRVGRTRGKKNRLLEGERTLEGTWGSKHQRYSKMSDLRCLWVLVHFLTERVNEVETLSHWLRIPLNDY